MVKDDPAQITKTLQRAVLENDLVIISAGSSAGTKDYTADVIAGLGEVLIHGVAIKPGKPAIIGRIDKKPIIGMPGYPLSALTVLREIVLPLVHRFGLPGVSFGTVDARFTASVSKDVGSDEFILCSLGLVGNDWVLSPLSRGAGVQMSAVRSNAYLKIPAGVEGFDKGKTVMATLTVSQSNAKQALLITGSHDPLVDYLADLLMEKDVDLHSTHVGSMGGILALKTNECHAAPMHLLAEDGDYNIPYLRKYLPGEEVVLICVAERQQGIVSKDGIGFDDLPGHLFVNRQRGSGTRMLLDHQMKQKGIDPSKIRGYEREVTTHLAVALAVKSGEADAGMCVYSAAKALGLGFIPVALSATRLPYAASILMIHGYRSSATRWSLPHSSRSWTGWGVRYKGDWCAAFTALSTASSGVAHFITPSISHVFIPKTGRFIFNAIAISDSVP